MKIDRIDVELQLHLPDAIRAVLALWALDHAMAPAARQPADAQAMGALCGSLAARGQPARISCTELAALHDYATRTARQAAGHPAPPDDARAEANQILAWLARS